MLELKKKVLSYAKAEGGSMVVGMVVGGFTVVWP
jgi:hypothetical protein